MSFQKTGLILLFLFCACTGPSRKKEELARDSMAHQIQQSLDTAQETGNLPALGVLATIDGKSIYLHTQGKRSLQYDVKVERKDQWHIGSNTKTMTAFLIALAVQEGRLSYESKLLELLGDRIHFHKLNRDLKVSHLLTHTSGLEELQELNEGKLWADSFHSTSPVRKKRLEITVTALATRPHLDPRTSSQPLRDLHYSNTNYVILGTLLESIFKKDWEELVRSKIFDPLQMQSCGFGVSGSPDETEPSQPWGHTAEGNLLIGMHPKEKADNPPWVGPAGTVHCNLEDWQKFLSEMHLTWNHKSKLLRDSKVVSDFFKPIVEGAYIRGGCNRNDEKYHTPVLQHSGSNTLNYAISLIVPERKISLLLATNSAQPNAENTLVDLKRSLLKLLLQSTGVDL